MGYFVRKTALGLKPINHTVEDEATVYETDGYCMSPGEYIEIQKILSSQKEKIARLQIEKEQEESEILDYYKNAFKKMKKEYSAKLTCEIQSFREKYSQPLIVQKEQLLMAENQIQTLKDKLEVSNVYALERENLNKNLLRIMKERANADREIVPKKKHHGYIILYLQELYVKQEANSNVLLNGMTLHNGTTRNTTEVLLAGEGAEINLCGMAIADKNQHIDNNTSIDHAVPNCTSNELFKYVLDDQSIGAFAGLVLVRPDAQHTNSQQTNRNLCATRDARMYTQPQLEIYADDVKCSHGATVGQLDENALFYMRSRGINEKEARLLLMFAFVNEVIDTIRLDALKDRLHLLVEKRFRGELNRCQGCAICK